MRVDSVSLHRDRIDVRLRFGASDPLRTSEIPALPRLVREQIPGVLKHTCTSAPDGRFVSEIGDTELAHLFEHVALELLALSGSPRDLEGNTSWDFGREGRGVFDVSFGYDHQRVGLKVVNAAKEVVDGLVNGKGPADVPRIVRQLELARRRASG